jgi:membrane protein DedA with SNARE-associated domain
VTAGGGGIRRGRRFSALYQVCGAQNKAITALVRLCDLMSRNGLAYLSSAVNPKGSGGKRGGEGIQGMEDFARALTDFVRDHQGWAAPIVMALAFGESLAFISLLIPAWGALVAIGALIGVTGISFWPVWIAGGIGAALGDWVSYWFGFKYKEQVAQMWPLSRFPEILPRGEAFVRKWGVPSIFIGRFFGPLRASVPLAAGIFEMSYWQFQVANFVSALIWSAALLVFGDVIGKLAEWLWRVV